MAFGVASLQRALGCILSVESEPTRLAKNNSQLSQHALVPRRPSSREGPAQGGVRVRASLAVRPAIAGGHEDAPRHEDAQVPGQHDEAASGDGRCRCRCWFWRCRCWCWRCRSRWRRWRRCRRRQAYGSGEVGLGAGARAGLADPRGLGAPPGPPDLPGPAPQPDDPVAGSHAQLGPRRRHRQQHLAHHQVAQAVQEQVRGDDSAAGGGQTALRQRADEEAEEAEGLVQDTPSRGGERRTAGAIFSRSCRL